MSDRSYLSIGEVLSLLTAEFPDVTISKIRFLESQGLIDPERTPSGYRKFYDADVERLKWILRQQRENFLPLKVIRGRLGDELGAEGEVSEDEQQQISANHPTAQTPSSPNEPTPERVVPAKEIVALINARWPLEPAMPAYRGEVAARYRYADGRGEIGLISSVTEPFCKDCHRARLSADGKFFTCLFAAKGWDVLGRLRGGASDADLAQYLTDIWAGRTDRYSDERAGLIARHESRPKVEMSYIGG